MRTRIHANPAKMTQRSAALLFAVLSATSGSAQQPKNQLHLRLDPAQTEVHFTLKDKIHTVRGSFSMGAGAIDFDPETGEASGQIVVDTASGASGNATRDGKMKADYLEVPSFPVATYDVSHVNGYDPQKALQKITVNGTMSLHGAKHALVMEFALSRDGQAMVAVTHFLIPYVAWGIKDPSTKLLPMEKEVLMEISARGTMTGPK